MDDIKATTTTINPGGYVSGSLHVPGDKSISHRYAILAALAEGESELQGYAPGADCDSTLRCLRQLGVPLESSTDSPTDQGGTITIAGSGLKGFTSVNSSLNAGNSGTTMRLMAGVLAAHSFTTTVTGDRSLSRRPMQRIVAPLQAMGAQVETHNGCPPLTITGRSLEAIDYTPPMASAQVKSAILLAGLQANGTTWIREPVQTRDHTERALPIFGVNLVREGQAVGIVGGQHLVATTLDIPGDFSSAAFWFVAAAALPRSVIQVSHVGLNPTRTRLLDVLQGIGAHVVIEPVETTSPEPYGTVTVSHAELHPIIVKGTDVPALIDELPALAALGLHGQGFRLNGATELRTKESDRIAVLVSGLRHMGAEVDEFSDGFEVYAQDPPSGGIVDAAGDHRMAMAFAIAALGLTGPTMIKNSDVVNVSYPGFFDTLNLLRHR